MMKQTEEKNNFKPFIPADRVVPELTVTSIVLGLLLAVLFGAANAYLGLRVGMTVSASIPAAVISMGVIRRILHHDSILENNMVQTIGSAGESLAAGAIFTMPALFMWAKESGDKNALDSGILYSSGLIAGEGLVGIVLAVLAVFGITDKINLGAPLGNWGGVIFFALLTASLVWSVLRTAKGEKHNG